MHDTAPNRPTNRLADQSSPYLLQHARNPVDWHPWGPEALELARSTQRPIFVSIGYSTCYWCHVMERQCFEDPDIAGLMNEHFVNIKIDREERPDLDDLYMTATQLLTGRGGWPMSVFLVPPPPDRPGQTTPEGSAHPAGPPQVGLRPFFAGTYFPPTPRHGVPSFPQVLTGAARAWRHQRHEVIEQADRVAAAVAQAMRNRSEPAAPSNDAAPRAVRALLRNFDPEHGGFSGDAGPKFPSPVNLLLLLRSLRARGERPDEQVRHALGLTLERMARGGLYDQIGGGFHRYSVDEKWLVPHFEKMLYDQGQLVEVYASAIGAVKIDGDHRFLERVVRGTCDYVLREMVDATGAFWSAQDAEVQAREGGNYLWQPEEVAAAVGDDRLARLALEMYGLTLGPNFRDPHDPEAPPASVLHLPQPLDELARRLGVPMEDLLRDKAEIDSAMLRARDRRPQPGTDDKCLTAWNGIAIAGLALAGRTLHEPGYHRAAAAAADAVLGRMATPDGGLYRSMRGGKANTRLPGGLDDYAFLSHGLIELHRATGEARRLDEARRLMAEADRRFDATAELGGGWFDASDTGDLFVRGRSSYDGAIASGNSRMVHNLIDLWEITGQRAWLDRALRVLASLGDWLVRAGPSMALMQEALLRLPDDEPAAPPPPQGPTGDAADPHVRVTVQPRGSEIDVRLDIAPGYHLAAHHAGSDAIRPATLSLDDERSDRRLSVRYPSAVRRRLPLGDEPIEVYEGTVVLSATLTGGGDSEGNPPRLVLRYQACSERECAMPREVTLPLPG